MGQSCLSGLFTKIARNINSNKFRYVMICPIKHVTLWYLVQKTISVAKQDWDIVLYRSGPTPKRIYLAMGLPQNELHYTTVIRWCPPKYCNKINMVINHQIWDCLIFGHICAMIQTMRIWGTAMRGILPWDWWPWHVCKRRVALLSGFLALSPHSTVFMSNSWMPAMKKKYWQCCSYDCTCPFQWARTGDDGNFTFWFLSHTLQ